MYNGLGLCVCAGIVAQKSSYFQKLNVRWSHSIAYNVLRFGVCYFALQTFQALDILNRQNNSTKPLLYAGGGWLNENQNATRI